MSDFRRNYEFAKNKSSRCLTGSDKSIIVGNGVLNLGSVNLRGVCWWEGKGGDVGWASGSMGNGELDVHERQQLGEKHGQLRLERR